MPTSDPPTKRNFSSTQNLIWKNGGKESKFYVKKIICTHETVLKNTKIDKICYAVLVQNCIAHTILLMVNPNKKNVVEETENNHNK